MINFDKFNAIRFLEVYDQLQAEHYWNGSLDVGAIDLCESFIDYFKSL